ncbi:unnamed protein product, partial [Gongylonema pulchrum]|uniref:RING-type E3 ubiquitin transferase n=1 Tax=Gongylonema pulchrum TaxID=637853 RepID=A0A183EL53_9BILA
MNNGSAPDTITGGKTLELTSYDRVYGLAFLSHFIYALYFELISGPKPSSEFAMFQHRRPHKAVTDSTEIRISTRMLSSELCCPICLDLLTTTMTTKECLHRFCSECITTALLRGNKECPTCRKKLVSKRSLRPDPNFDALINKIWPDRQIYEQMQQKAMEMFHQQSNVEALQKSIEAGMKAQAANRRQRVQGSYDYEKRKRRLRSEIHYLSYNNSPESNSPEGSAEGDETDLHARHEDTLSAANTSSAWPTATRLIERKRRLRSEIHYLSYNNSPESNSPEGSAEGDETDLHARHEDTLSAANTSSAWPTATRLIDSDSLSSTTDTSLTTDSSDLSSSASVSMEPSSVTHTDGRLLVPPLNVCTLKDRMHKWLAENPSSPLTPDEGMGEQLERR